MTMFGAEAVYKALSAEMTARVDIITRDVTASTNLDVKELAQSGAAEGAVVIAGCQTAGRGRHGRSFWSPGDAGLYMSILLRPRLDAAEAIAITACAAPAVAEAIESVCDCEAGIKWVNDVYVRGRKVCGILTESVVGREAGMEYAVLGIGINVADVTFPEELREKAGSLGISGEQRPLLAARVIENFFRYYDKLPEKAYLAEYRRRSILTGKTVSYTQSGVEHTAEVLGIGDDNTLVVRDSSGEEVRLNSGEVSVIIKR